MPGSTDPEGLALDPALTAGGVNVAGVLPVAAYDARVPEGWKARDWLSGAASAVVLATGGAGFYRAFQAAPGGGDSEHPLDDFLAGLLERAVDGERRLGFEAVAAGYFERRGPDGGRFANFVSLAERAGLGRTSRLGILVHPVFGPWIAIRGLLLTERRLAPSEPDPEFRGCEGCPAPCQTACPGGAVAVGGFDLARCLETSRGLPACRVGCAARRACVLGPEHRYPPAAEARFRSAALAVAFAEPEG